MVKNIELFFCKSSFTYMYCETFCGSKHNLKSTQWIDIYVHQSLEHTNLISWWSVVPFNSIKLQFPTEIHQYKKSKVTIWEYQEYCNIIVTDNSKEHLDQQWEESTSYLGITSAAVANPGRIYITTLFVPKSAWL